MKKIGLLIIFIIIFSQIAFSETIEEQRLRMREQKIMTYIYQARNGDRNQKIDVLDKILAEFDTLKYSADDKKLVDLVVFLTEEGSTRQEFENGRLVNDFPEVRRKSVQVLGKLGGDEARDALINILINDQSAAVRAEACLSLAKVGDNTNGEALSALVYIYRSTYKPDPNFVMAIIQAVKELAKDNSTAYADAIYILSEIQIGNYNRNIRDAAYEAIRELSGD